MKAKIFFLLVLFFQSNIAYCQNIVAKCGKQTVIIPPNNRFGFQHFPDAQPVVLSKSPANYLMTVGMQHGKGIGTTFVMQGPTMEKAVPVRVALRPSGTKDTYDETHAGIGGMYIDKDKDEILVFFNAERAVELPTPQGGRYRSYASCGVAVSKDKGKSFEKLGPYLSGRPLDPDWQGNCQGNACPSICVDHTGQWLYCYYHEHSRKNPATGQNRSVIICMARSKITDSGKPGTWQKYYEGDFSQPGLGGFDSEIADMFSPHVTYIPEMKKYILMGARDGPAFCHSDDGIHWSPRIDLFGEHCIRVPENANEPVYSACTFVLESASSSEAKGTLLYTFSPNEKVPGHFVSRPVTFSLQN